MKVKDCLMLGSFASLCAAGTVLADSATLTLEAEIRDSCRVTLTGVESGAVSVDVSDEGALQRDGGIGLNIECRNERQGYTVSVSSGEGTPPIMDHFQLTSATSPTTPIGYRVVVRKDGDTLIDTGNGDFSGETHARRLSVKVDVDQNDVKNAGPGSYSDDVIFTVSALPA